MVLSVRDREILLMACEIANENIDKGGDPFGAVIVKDGAVIATGANTVTLDNDAMAHAVVNAIRRACQLTGSCKLDGCTIYCSSEPCSMCKSALHAVGIERILFANANDAVFSARALQEMGQKG